MRLHYLPVQTGSECVRVPIAGGCFPCQQMTDEALCAEGVAATAMLLPSSAP